MRATFALVLAVYFLASTALRADEPAPAPVPVDQAAAKMTLPEGFKATLFAGEPDVVQPIAFCFDDRGRLWVVENMAYPDWLAPGKPGTDRIVIFEDENGDGKFDKKTTFLDNGENYSGIELGFGGVYVCATPYFLFIPDRNRDDKPDGPPEVLLDGWDLKARHNVFNGLSWGPDGWLWGCNGILSNSLVGKPGTPDEKRVPINCGVWRYHPTLQEFEVVAHGTTNPWGLDFDDYGHAFITNCVIHHLWHVVPGAHFQRMFGQDMAPYSFELLPSCADYLHWAGGPWQSSRNGEEHRRAGGGHAHVGAMIYLGDNWPAQYRNSLFTCNIHGNRVNEDKLRQVGSAYDAERAPDFLFANDSWHRGLELAYGPDGGVFLTDWCDTDECHDYVDIHRENGRIFKITYGDVKPWTGDLQTLSTAELIELQKHPNDWFVRHARRILQERLWGTATKADVDAIKKLLYPGNDALSKLREAGAAQETDANDPEMDSRRRLRGLWALWAVDALDTDALLNVLQSSDAHLREWGVRFAAERPLRDKVALKLLALAKNDPSPAVRLALASALPRLTDNLRGAIALSLVAHAEDANDRTLPLMIWYGVEPLISAGAINSNALLNAAKMPTIRRLTARRLSIPGEKEFDVVRQELTRWLAQPHDDDSVRDVLTGMLAAYEGASKPEPPPMLSADERWETAARKFLDNADPAIRNRAAMLSLYFGDQRAGDVLRKVIFDKSKPIVERQESLAALVAGTAPEAKRMWVVGDGQVEELKIKTGDKFDLSPMLVTLLDEPAMRVSALRLLPTFRSQSSGEEILKRYDSFSLSEKQEALATLASRVVWAQALVAAIEAKKLPQSDVSAYTVRQLQALKDDAINAQLTKLWGALRAPAEGKAEMLKQYKTWLTSTAIQAADAKKGRELFTKTCAGCHKLFDAGGNVGPNLTGSQRANIDYFLENLLDPSAVVAREYQSNVVETVDGRTIVGVVDKETTEALFLKTPGGLVTVPKSDVESREQSPLSLMPENMLTLMPREDVLNLAKYLASDEQVAVEEPTANEQK